MNKFRKALVKFLINLFKKYIEPTEGERERETGREKKRKKLKYEFHIQ